MMANWSFIKIWLPAIFIFIIGTVILIIVGFINNNGIGYLIWWVFILISGGWVFWQKNIRGKKVYITFRSQKALDDASDYNIQATESVKKGQLNQAIAGYNEAIKIVSNRPLYYCNRGFAYAQRGNLDLAIKDYNKAINLDSKYAPAYHHRGHIYYSNKQFESAINDFSLAIKYDSKYCLAYYSRGSVFFEKKEWDKAIADFDKAIEIEPDFAPAYMNRSIAYYENSQIDKSEADLRMILKISNDPKMIEQANDALRSYFDKQ